jgi:hypothetical protein
VSFPAKERLALNWRELESYLQVSVLYKPPYCSMESGDAFCVFEVNDRWTLVILQCTIAEQHPTLSFSSFFHYNMMMPGSM